MHELDAWITISMKSDLFLGFLKTDKTGLEQFYRFTKNPLVQIKKIKSLENFEKKSKTKKMGHKSVKSDGLPFFI
jgi:hypothetical protein